MIGIVIVAHGDLGKELLRSAEMICGKQDRVVTLGLQAGDAIEALPTRIAEAIKSLDDVDGVLVLVDLFGGSPCNAALRYLAESDVECISGVNLPMLLEILMQRESTGVKELAAQAMRAGHEGIQDLGTLLRQQLGK